LTAASFTNSLAAMGSREFKLFRELIHRETGIWLRDGKQAMLASRLSKRLRHLGMTSFADYYSYVGRTAGRAEELGELINCVTTNKTSFFRENHHFDLLAETVVPEIQQAALRGAARSVRIWSAACSTGQEPYSIAITLLESLRAARPTGAPGSEIAAPPGWEVELVASDIDTAVLATGARGVYEDDALESVPQHWRKKYFLRGTGSMLGRIRVKPELARLVEFKRINLMDKVWPVEGPFDAIFLRNALIYFDRQTQEIFLRRMVRLLRPRGYLFIGHSEHVPWLHDVVTPLNNTVYRRKEGPN
jgi:chemotaxis protein methyltransferase CheR